MAVAGASSRVIVVPNSGIQPLRAQRGSAQEGVGPETGYEAWVMYAKTTGDGTGGEAVFTFTFPPNAPYYYTVTALYTVRKDTGASTLLRMNTLMGDWEVFTGEDGVLHSNLNEELATIAGQSNTVNSVGLAGFKPRYLGRGITADSIVEVVWQNTDTILYDCRLAGLRSLRPGIPWYDALQQGRLL